MRITARGVAIMLSPRTLKHKNHKQHGDISMALIKWVGSVNANFSNAANWQGGVLPGSEDIAQFDALSGSCTLDGDILLHGLVIEPSFAGTFQQNGRKITVNQNGKLHLIKVNAALISINGAIDFSGSELMIYNASVNETSGSDITIRGQCSYWYTGTSGSQYFLTLSQAENSVMTIRDGTGNDYGVNFSGFAISAKTLDLRGTIDFSQTTINQLIPMVTSVTFRGTCKIVNKTNGRLMTWYAPSMSPQIYVEDGFSVDLVAPSQLRLASWYGSNVNFNAGDYRSFRILIGNNASKFTLKTGRTVLSQFIIESSATSGCGFVQTSDNVCVFLADISPVYACSMPNRITLSELADQILDLTNATNAVSLAIEKPAGKITILNGNLSLFSDSETGSLVIPPEFAGSFLQNGKKLTIHENGVLHLLKVNASGIVLDGNIDFSGVEFLVYNAAIPSVVTNNVTVRSSCDWWFNAASSSTAWNSMTQTSDSVISVKRGLRPDYDITVTSVTVFTAKKQDWHGTIDFESQSGTYNCVQGEVVFHETSRVISAGTNHWYTPGTSGSVEIKPGATLSLNIRLVSQYNGNLILKPGDFRQVTVHLSGTGNGNNNRITLPEGVHRFDKIIFSQGLFLQDENNICQCFGDLTANPGAGLVVAFPDRITLKGHDQTIDDRKAANTPGYIIEDATGNLTFLGHCRLAGDSRMERFSAGMVEGDFDQNGFEIRLTGDAPVFDYPEDRFDLSGNWRFENASKVTILHAALGNESKLIFESDCMLDVFSDSLERQLPHIEVCETARVTFASFDPFFANRDALVTVSGNLLVYGTLSASGFQTLRLEMLGDDTIFSAGKLVASGNTQLVIDPGLSQVRFGSAAIEGDVKINWSKPDAVARILPGDYRVLTNWELNANVESVQLSEGDYYFSVLGWQGSQGVVQEFSSESNGPVRCHGSVRLTEKGTWNAEAENLKIESLFLDGHMTFQGNEIAVDHPQLISGSSISGQGILTVCGNGNTIFEEGSLLAVEEFHVLNGDGFVIRPATGFQTLKLISQSFDSSYVFDGEYQLQNLVFAPNGHILTVDVRKGPQIEISGDIDVLESQGGTLRLLGDYSDSWVLTGANDQTLSFPLQQGYHVLGNLVYDKTGGVLALTSPLTAAHAFCKDGGPFPETVNLIDISEMFLNGKLFLIADGHEECFSQDGFRLENIAIMRNATVRFYAAIMNRNGEPLHPDFIESIRLNLQAMNPVAPSLHAARKEIIRNRELILNRVFFPQWQSNELLPEDEQYNFTLASHDVYEMRFEHPGLYYVTCHVKLFGKKNATPIRFELHCDR